MVRWRYAKTDREAHENQGSLLNSAVRTIGFGPKRSALYSDLGNVGDAKG